MSSAHWTQVKTLFAAAADLAPEDRAAFLTLESGGDAVLIAEVQSLLDSHDQPGPFLDTMPHEFRAQAFASSNAARGRVGERVGSYRIVGTLGSGGMGDVFKAVRDDAQYHAEVAIKLMRADMRSSFTEQRFKNERQILAGLDHRNIARLLDGGTTANGVPYVVMELVGGQAIDAWCAARRLGVRDRVQLFLQVCAAVSYAHQQLIVHRDLKPNNILVTADGSVKLLDFGIAKLLEAEADTAVADDKATATTMRAMTLEYASPEQVSGAQVTTVSDVYSLGVVLYRLLTGKSPYAARANDAARIAEIVGDTAPTRPSQVERKVDADLDNILLMALRKEPQRRYASVEQLANDLRNYLTGMPVRARGNSLRYRASKFMRRRKIEIAATVLVACALLGAAGFSLREARIADHERRIAEQHFASVRKLANTMLFQLHDEMAKVPGSIKTREMLVKTSLEYLDELYKASNADHALQEELAAAYSKVGDIMGNEYEPNIGDYQGALRSYARSVALLEPLVAQDPSNVRLGSLLADTYGQQASLMLVADSAADAQVVGKKGIQLSEALARSVTDRTERARLLAVAYTVQANILYAVGRNAEGVATLEKLLAVCEELHTRESANDRATLLLTAAYANVANHADPRLSQHADRERAIDLLRRALRHEENLVTRNSTNVGYRAALMRTQYNLGRMLAWRGDHSEALELFRLATSVANGLAQDPNDARSRYISALMNSAYADALFKVGRIEEARALFLQCEAVLGPLIEQGGTLRIIYARGHNSVRLGLLYEAQANARAGTGEMRRDSWTRAREALHVGVTELQKVTARVQIEPLDRVALDAGIAGLRRVSAMPTAMR